MVGTIERLVPSGVVVACVKTGSRPLGSAPPVRKPDFGSRFRTLGQDAARDDRFDKRRYSQRSVTTQQKQKVFVYERKEIVLLSLLGMLVATFAFTLGIHLGKRVVPPPPPALPSEATSASTVGDAAPTRQEIQEQAKGLIDGADETVAQDLHEEVTKEGLKLSAGRQVELPKGTKTSNAGATTPRAQGHSPTAPSRGSVFALQVGAFPSLEEASAEMKALEAHGMKPFLKQVDVKSKKWFRVFLGGYENAQHAQAAGQSYKEKNWIKSFIVTRPHD